jgi:hypothetical protein
MKVGIYETVEVDDVQRAAIAKQIGKLHATRDDMKAFIWEKGAHWADGLAKDWSDDVDEANADDDGLLDPAEPDADLGDLI